MTDPLSVTAGVIGIVAAAAQISSLLVKFTTKFKDAPRQASIILTEVSDTSSVLAQLQPFLLGFETPDQSRACLLQVESVIAMLTGCVATFSELQQVLDSLEIEDMQPSDRLKWSRRERDITALHSRLKTHKASLSLMLNVLNCNTMNEVKASVDGLEKSMQKSYSDIIARVHELENQRASSSSQLAIAVTRTNIGDGSGGVQDLSGGESAIRNSLSQSSRKFNYIFEKDLALTRLYKKIKLRGSGTSIFTTEHPETRWSTISDLSVADVISRLSVYELGITPSEIHKSEQYTSTSAGNRTERVSTDSPEEGSPATKATVTQATKTTSPSLREARELQKLWRIRDLTLPEPTDLPFKNMKRSLLPRWTGSEGLNQWLFQIFELKEIYRSQAPSVILLDYVTNALKYFHQYRDITLSLTTGQVVRDFVRMLGILGPDADLLDTRKHTLYILYNEANNSQRPRTWIHRLQPDDAPFRLIRNLNISGRKPWITIQPETLELPATGYVDVTNMHLGRFVDGWLLHQELYHSHLFSDDTIQQLAFRSALYYSFLDPILKGSGRDSMTQFHEALSIEPVMLNWDGLAPDCSSVEHLAGDQIWRPAYK